MKKLKQVVEQNINSGSDENGKFITTDANILRRFLVMGSDDNTYYYSAENRLATGLESLAREVKRDGVSVVDMILEVSENGYNLKQEPVIFSLVYCLKFGNEQTKQAVENVFNRVVRTGTMLFMAVDYIKLVGGFGRKTKRIVSNWYLSQPTEKMTYQMVKYRNRNSWSHKDVLRLCHAKTDNDERNAVFKWAIDSTVPELVNSTSNDLISAYETLKNGSDTAQCISFIKEFDLTWEMIPNQFLKEKLVLRQLAEKMPLGATIRYLNRFAVADLNDGKFIDSIVEKLTNKENIKNAKLHPLAIFLAMKQYECGYGGKGSLRWTPNKKVLQALDKCLEKSFDFLEPTGKRIFVALDVSGSMHGTFAEKIKPIEAACIMIRSFIRAEGLKNVDVGFFSSTFKIVDARAFDKPIGEVLKFVYNQPFAYTNLSLPVTYALETKREYDAFVVYTDNEVNYGPRPYEVLKEYRQTCNKNTKYIVQAFELSKFSVAQPNDKLSLDIPGKDPSSGKVTQMFLNGVI